MSKCPAAWDSILCKTLHALQGIKLSKQKHTKQTNIVHSLQKELATNQENL